MNTYSHYVYSKERADSYLKRQKGKKRILMAIVNEENDIVGELIFKEIVENESVTLGITMNYPKYKDEGYGTIAEKLAIDYAFNTLKVKVVYADCIMKNTRSQHVLNKVGFKEIRRDTNFIYYEIRNTNSSL